MEQILSLITNLNYIKMIKKITLKPRLVKLLLVAVLFSSCSYKKEDCKHKLVVTSYNGSGWYRSSHSIKCDSVNMLGTKKAEIFIDGTKMIIEADDKITVHSNRN